MPAGGSLRPGGPGEASGEPGGLPGAPRDPPPVDGLIRERARRRLPPRRGPRA